ncbi:hypothetical protein CRENBAI_009619 [Crenichthys baileyi]|uniref:Uncharacterized protein n=1 Tax=Crenichthys baileyi TaxID=28760 RepID=A0AAV9RD50_9TELE
MKGFSELMKLCCFTSIQHWVQEGPGENSRNSSSQWGSPAHPRRFQGVSIHEGMYFPLLGLWSTSGYPTHPLGRGRITSTWRGPVVQMHGPSGPGHRLEAPCFQDFIFQS